MASTINTNINSLTAQRNLSTSQATLSTSLQRLSSGLRSNSAKDDAAGLAIWVVNRSEIARPAASSFALLIRRPEDKR